MTQKDLLSFIYSIYPQMPWETSNLYDYRNSEEHKRYRFLRSQHMNNYSKKLAGLMNKHRYILINENRSYDYCFKYVILSDHIRNLLDNDRLLLKSMGGKRTDVCLYVSKLMNIFTMECVETVLNIRNHYEEWTFRKIPFVGSSKNIFDLLHDFLSKNGLEFINLSVLNQVVPNIETKFTSIGNATIFDLLFTPFHEFFVEKTICL